MRFHICSVATSQNPRRAPLRLALLGNSPEFGGIMAEAGTNRFLLSVKQWIERTNARGLVAKAGRYGGTYAQKDLAFEFASWVSPKFKLYLIRDYQRLKADEQAQLGWSAKRELAKINYRKYGEHQRRHDKRRHPSAPAIEALERNRNSPDARIVRDR